MLRALQLAGAGLVIGASAIAAAPDTAHAGSHTVVSGDSLGKIARSNGTDIATLVKLNNIANPDIISVGQVIDLPGGDTSEKTTGSVTVRAGDGFYAIAQRHNVDMTDLLAANNMTVKTMIHPGQKLRLPGAETISETISEASGKTMGDAQTLDAQVAAPEKPREARVRPGDGFYAIAQRHDVDMADLLAANNMTVKTVIHPGQKLRLPGMEPLQAMQTAAIHGPPLPPPPVPPRRPTIGAHLASGTLYSDIATGNDNFCYTAVTREETLVHTVAADGSETSKTETVLLQEDPFHDLTGSQVTADFMISPVGAQRITSPYGMRNHPVLGRRMMHTGIDLAGQRIRAAAPGTVIFRGWRGANGKLIRVRHDDGTVTAYAHMRNYGRGTHVGARVERGQYLGRVGSTGRSTGPHLHWEVQTDDGRIDPMQVDHTGALAGTTDCSGWASRAVRRMMHQVNEAADTPVFEAESLRAVLGNASDMVVNIADRTGWIMNREEITTDVLKPGMMLAVDTGEHRWDSEGAHWDLVGVVHRNPEKGRLDISHFSRRSDRVVSIDAKRWLDRYGNRADMVLVDPLRMHDLPVDIRTADLNKPLPRDNRPSAPRIPDGETVVATVADLVPDEARTASAVAAGALGDMAGQAEVSAGRMVARFTGMLIASATLDDPAAGTDEVRPAQKLIVSLPPAVAQSQTRLESSENGAGAFGISQGAVAGTLSAAGAAMLLGAGLRGSGNNAPRRSGGFARPAGTRRPSRRNGPDLA